MDSPEAQPLTVAPALATGLEALRGKLSGTLHLPAEPKYVELAAPWNLAVTTSPAAVVAAGNAADVVESLRFAAAAELPVAVQATGHGVASTMAGALLIHTRSLDTCTIRNTSVGVMAYTGAGLTWRAVLDACHGLGLAPLCGSAPGVGVVGYTTGGGVGPMVRTFGAASDRVTAFDVVTGDGVVRHVTASTEPGLFWGLRGGKGALGIVTGMEFELLPLPEIYAGTLFFAARDLTAILHAWAQWCPTLPLQATTSIAIMHLPPVPGVPEPLAGRFAIAVRYVHTGCADDGGTWLAPMRAAGVPLMDTVGPMPPSLIGLVHSDPEDRLPAAENSTLLTDFNDAAANALLEVAGPDSGSPQVMVEIRQFGGALALEPDIPSALCHRDAGFGLYTVGIGAPDELAAVKEHSANVVEKISPWAYGGSLANFAAGDGVAGFTSSYTAPVLERLSSLATHFDPGHLFRLGQVPSR